MTRCASIENAWQVRVCQADGSTAGAGILLGDDLVLTCAHVVLTAGGGPDPASRVTVTSVLCQDPWTAGARVADRCWKYGATRPDSRGQLARGDITLLKLDRKVTCHSGARLWQGRINDLAGKLARASGFPEAGAPGVDANARIQGFAFGGELVNLHPEPAPAPRIVRGFSGAGLIPHPGSAVPGHGAAGHVIGVVIAALDAPAESNAYAYMMPAEVIAGYLEPVRPFLDGEPTFDPEPGPGPSGRAAARGPRSDTEAALQHEIAGLFSGTWSGTLAAAGCGTGSSSWLTRVLMSSNPAARAGMPDDGERGPSLPVGAIDLSVDARGRDAAYVRRRIAKKFGLPEDAPGREDDLASRLAGLDPAPAIVIHHADTAADPGSLMKGLVEPLAARAHRRGVRLILGFGGQLPPGLSCDLALTPEPPPGGPPRDVTSPDTVRDRVAELAKNENRLADRYAGIRDRIAGAPAPAPRLAPQLRVWLASAPASPDDPALRLIHGHCARALERALTTADELEALGREHDDLAGALEAYRSRAERLLGPSDTSLSARYQAAREALRSRPCDLALARRAVKAYTDEVWQLGDREGTDEDRPASWRDTAPCGRPGCRGRIGGTGRCGTCHLPPPPPSGNAGGGLVPADPWWGRHLVTVEPATEREPEPLPVKVWPTNRRNCRKCEAPVGRYGRDNGNCPKCQTSFHFSPRLKAGDKLDNGRYEIQELLSYGGFGWAYLADDHQLESQAVIKGLMDDQVAHTVTSESATLAGLDHPYIVKILGSMTEQRRRYLAFDYIPGGTLRPLASGEPPGQLLALAVQLLEALDYLHRKGFLHCDVKPENVVRTGTGIRLIDFGAVRKITDTGPVAITTDRYAPPRGDPERRRPTAAFDLYSVGKTIEALTGGYLASRADEPAAESLRLLVRRATSGDPDSRFTTARQFGDQLSGVIRQVTRARTAHPSMSFGTLTESLDGGLGSAVPLNPRARPGRRRPGILDISVSPFRPPPPEEAAAALPAARPGPQSFGPGGTAADDHLQRCHAAIRNRDPGTAARQLAEAELAPADWRGNWYRALITLTDTQLPAAQRAARAEPDLAAVRAAVPGELVPLLALGLCAEWRRRPALAWTCYALVSEADETMIAAHFGLARVLLGWGQREPAATALDQVPPESRFEPDARIGAIHCLAAVITTEDGDVLAPSEARVNSARARRGDKNLVLDTATAALLDVELAYALATAGAAPSAQARKDLDTALRGAAAVASTERLHETLVDLANAVRPATIWSW